MIFEGSFPHCEMMIYSLFFPEKEMTKIDMKKKCKKKSCRYVLCTCFFLRGHSQTTFSGFLTPSLLPLETILLHQATDLHFANPPPPLACHVNVAYEWLLSEVRFQYRNFTCRIFMASRSLALF